MKQGKTRWFYYSDQAIRCHKYISLILGQGLRQHTASRIAELIQILVD